MKDENLKPMDNLTLGLFKKEHELLNVQNPPKCPADPRPDNKPYYIISYCPKCKTPLVLADLLEDPKTPENKIWYDEFICSKCQDGIYMDWPEEKYKETFEQDEEGNEEFKNFKFELLDKIRTRNSNKVNLKELESDIKEAIIKTTELTTNLII